jgi:hypothetical protein
MKQLMVRYKVKPDQAERNAELIRPVFAELEQTAPEGFHYAAFRLDDGLTFLHVVAQEDEGNNPLPELDAFRRFTADIRDRCDEQPVFMEADVVGSFRLFDR